MKVIQQKQIWNLKIILIDLLLGIFYVGFTFKFLKKWMLYDDCLKSEEKINVKYKLAKLQKFCWFSICIVFLCGSKCNFLAANSHYETTESVMQSY